MSIPSSAVCLAAQVERLMRGDGLRVVRRGRQFVTTRPDTGAQRAPDLVKRNFSAERPNQLWVVDFERHEAPMDRVVMRDTTIGSSQRAG